MSLLSQYVISEVVLYIFWKFVSEYVCVRVSSMTKSKVKNEKVISLPPRAPLFRVAIHVQPSVDSDHQVVVVVAESVQKSDIKKRG